MISNADVRLGPAAAAARPVALGAPVSHVGRAGQVALMLQLLQDLLHQLLDPLLGIVCRLPVLAEQLLQHLVRQQAAVQQRFENRVVQRVGGHALLSSYGDP